MKKILKTLMFATITLACVSLAQAETASRVAVVNIQHILQSSQKVADVNTKLKDEFQARQEALTAKQKLIQGEIDDLKKNEAVLDASQVTEKQKQIAQDRAAFFKQASDFQNDFGKAQADYMKVVFDDLHSVIERVAKSQGYNIVIDNQAVAYSDSTLDLTQSILDAFQKS